MGVKPGPSACGKNTDSGCLGALYSAYSVNEAASSLAKCRIPLRHDENISIFYLNILLMLISSWEFQALLYRAVKLSCITYDVSCFVESVHFTCGGLNISISVKHNMYKTQRAKFTILKEHNKHNKKCKAIPVTGRGGP
jgi:hypothetical protein